MRDLTQQEIDNAPEWATHYFIQRSFVVFESDIYYQAYSERSNELFSKGKHENIGSSISARAKPIPRPEFDISEYEFDDSNINIAKPWETKSNKYIKLETLNEEDLDLSRFDTIALAKHFKLTAADLL